MRRWRSGLEPGPLGMKRPAEGMSRCRLVREDRDGDGLRARLVVSRGENRDSYGLGRDRHGVERGQRLPQPDETRSRHHPDPEARAARRSWKVLRAARTSSGHLFQVARRAIRSRTKKPQKLRMWVASCSVNITRIRTSMSGDTERRPVPAQLHSGDASPIRRRRSA
jgi:hypothetical protein